jgi:uncharacterized protein YigE (DUF2233 family)
MNKYLLAGVGLAMLLGVACTSSPTPTLSGGLAQPAPTLPRPTVTPLPTPSPFLTPQELALATLPPPTLTPSPTATLDDPLWEDRTPGVERREIVVEEPYSGVLVKVHMVRLDPTLIDFKVHYEPGKANTISGWQADTGALVVVNGGFFDEKFRTQGLAFVDGQEYGEPIVKEDRIGIAGIFGVKDGEVSIVPFGRQPPPPGTFDFDYATEAYPMLLVPGGLPAYPEETGHAAERTVVAIDRSGRVIFMVIRADLFTLFGLSNMLAELDELDLEIALNLDGGKSSGMEVWAGSEHTHWNAESVLPIAIAAYPKEGVPVVPKLDVTPVLK